MVVMWRIREWLLVFSPRRWSYAWRRSRHVAVAGELCAYCGNPALGYARGYQHERLCHHEDRDCYHQVTVYGSMDLDAERALGMHLPAYLAAPLDPLPGWGTVASGWREQVADGLSPEALDSDVQPDPYLDAIAAEYGSEYPDSGPGVPSLAPPGPDPALPFTWAPEVRETLRPDLPADLTRLADTGDLTDARLLADVQADMRAREDGCLAFLAGFAVACERVRLDLSASLA